MDIYTKDSTKDFAQKDNAQKDNPERQQYEKRKQFFDEVKQLDKEEFQ